jgi:hypothetical protein
MLKIVEPSLKVRGAERHTFAGVMMFGSSPPAAGTDYIN